ncbi:unnamed protein product (macronuclear) [Paramecium tetraurelia]|uniref:Replication factor A C-terminal domain-containing protein n=1 Tax=Paramecium tetraurelia TaxID=5888 RepID=A0DIA6_PARTE|nr:uncharacterized protein GSPATT00017145001 [Paramecium tetraurelia]CAK82773.1 unnamed protein product [Paramecium tetraurelia]|eukprot:XP_001450170.1 hypothetical protein (macronuclear) [Paramecium tetraurelia strain d4-2]
MGNIIKNDQFKKGLQELLQNKKFKRTLKIIYKEKKNQILSVQSCQIFDNDFSIKQRLDQREGMPIIFEHNCKILLDVTERQRYFDSCTLCNKKIKWDRSLSFCPNCKQETTYQLAYCLVVKIIDQISEDNQVTYKATMFGEAAKYLGISAKDFSNMSHDSQNDYLKNINEQKSHIVHSLKLEFKKNLVIQEILTQAIQ